MSEPPTPAPPPRPGAAPAPRCPSVYLAGPDVFFPDAAARFDALEARCAAAGLRGRRPSDGGLAEGLGGSGDEIAERIYRGNVALIARCDGLLANLMPFRNPIEPDSGTVFEVGMAVALGKPVVGLLGSPRRPFERRVAEACGLRRDANGIAWDATHGFLVECFDQPLNLMLSRSVELFDDLEAAIARLAARLGVPDGQRR